MSTYRINDVYRCIQGEGCQTGQSMVLIRLHGCGVGCPWCDTKETWVAWAANRVDSLARLQEAPEAWCEADADTIARHARSLGPSIPWALVTGGEPAEQSLLKLTEALHAEGFKVAIETSGTARGHLGAGFDWVTVSPKIEMPGGFPVLLDVVAEADEIKHVVGTPADIAKLDALLGRGQLKPSCVVCLQPVSGNRKATELCAATVKDRGWRLSIQVHRLLGEK